ncbi:MAG: guanylate kinase [Acidobacteria bacterium]|nr:guanylate kinase [Acidobacteriota bacterium]
MAGQIFIVSGPSGSGKTSIVEHLLASVPDLLFSVSYTTRGPRPGEQEGREYFFVSREEFEAMKARGDFLEHAQVFNHYYGTHRRVLVDAERAGKDLVLDIDVKGAQQVKRKLPPAVAILILPPSWQELERRLRARGLDSPEDIQRRLERARQEVESCATYDYVVINRDLSKACAQVEAIVRVERQRLAGETPGPAELVAQAEAARKDATVSQVSAILETFGARAK